MQSAENMLYSTRMTMDHLSQMLDLIAVRGVVSGGAVTSGPWRAESIVDDELKFCVMARGEAWLATDGIDAAIHLVQGEVVVLNARSWLSLRGGDRSDEPTEVTPPSNGAMMWFAEGAGERTDAFIGGRIDLDGPGRGLLLDALPPVAHIRAKTASAGRMRGTVDRLFDELASARPGSSFAVREYAQLLILEALRAFAGGTAVRPGWLGLLADDRLRPALELIHGRPGAALSLNDLARAASMSRTAFAVRFRELAGMPPLTYLARWRMMLAKRELGSEDIRLRTLARELGYSSESSFSAAFKRSEGESPRSYRTRVLSESARAPLQSGTTGRESASFGSRSPSDAVTQQGPS